MSGIDKHTFARLSELSKLNFTESEEEKLAGELGALISIIEKIKKFDETADGGVRRIIPKVAD
ncbi:MAG: hypothetical protein LBI38_06605 [Oscillospiraceae bacterium]|jgi:Asp-tRNA(Asn)/Glu-tRNA(Gln) amidotransferase C subunit|nr:hypothetical protein [Oscillospiraceae bacterium]